MINFSGCEADKSSSTTAEERVEPYLQSATRLGDVFIMHVYWTPSLYRDGRNPCKKKL